MTTVPDSEVAWLLDRFDYVQRQTLRLFSIAPDRGLDWIPVDTPTMGLGDRLDRITVGDLMRHFILAESLWCSQLGILPPGATMPIPPNSKTLADLKTATTLTEAYREAHTRNRAALRVIPATVWNEPITIAGLSTTRRGFLWEMIEHNVYHRGQLDTCLRLLEVHPPSQIGPHKQEQGEASEAA